MRRILAPASIHIIPAVMRRIFGDTPYFIDTMILMAYKSLLKIFPKGICPKKNKEKEIIKK